MNDREEWRERVRDIRAASTIWWWWYIYIYIYIYICICIYMYKVVFKILSLTQIWDLLYTSHLSMGLYCTEIITQIFSYGHTFCLRLINFWMAPICIYVLPAIRSNVLNRSTDSFRTCLPQLHDTYWTVHSVRTLITPNMFTILGVSNIELNFFERVTYRLAVWHCTLPGLCSLVYLVSFMTWNRQYLASEGHPHWLLPASVRLGLSLGSWGIFFSWDAEEVRYFVSAGPVSFGLSPAPIIKSLLPYLSGKIDKYRLQW